MPRYEYDCPEHGVFEQIADINRNGHPEPCPACGELSPRIMSRPARLNFVQKERLPLGEGSRGKYIPPEGDRHGILVPSWGALEKDEVEYTAMAALEIEEERVKLRKERPKRDWGDQKDVLEKVTQAALRAPQGHRAETIQNCIVDLRHGRQI